MKQKISLALVSLVFGLSFLLLPNMANAWWYYGGHGYYHGYHRGYVNCRVVGGYWRHGYWHPAHRVCWRR